MKRKGFEGEPFQLLIGMITFGMALMIGWYLFDMVQCWKCNEMLNIEGTNLRETITSVGQGYTNTKQAFQIDVTNIGSCAIGKNKGIFLRKVESGSGLNCRNFCPNHPNSCWVVITSSSCGDQKTEIDCIDISGDTQISIAPELNINALVNPSDQWLDGAYFFATNRMIRIEKIDTNEIEIGNP